MTPLSIRPAFSLGEVPSYPGICLRGSLPVFDLHGVVRRFFAMSAFYNHNYR